MTTELELLWSRVCINSNWNDTSAYLRDGHNIWIVANSKRAVTNKKAKELLSKSLRRQLLMDGHYDSLAFISTHRYIALSHVTFKAISFLCKKQNAACVWPLVLLFWNVQKLETASLGKESNKRFNRIFKKWRKNLGKRMTDFANLVSQSLLSPLGYDVPFQLSNSARITKNLLGISLRSHKCLTRRKIQKSQLFNDTYLT